MLLRRRMMGGGGELPYGKQYLTTEILGDGTFTFSADSYISTLFLQEVSYSINNGATWVTTQNTGSGLTITTPSLQAGDKVLWKAISTRLAYDNNENATISCTSNFIVYGNIMSLREGDNFIGKEQLTERAFGGLFRASSVIDASNLILPSMSLAVYCYAYMFYSSSLQYPAQLPATTLATGCYQAMYNRCKLKEAPELNATTVVTNCYYAMFHGNTRSNTFTKLRMMATNYIANAFTNWVGGVQINGGTFYKSSLQTSLPSGNSGIPTNWTVVNV